MARQSKGTLYKRDKTGKTIRKDNWRTTSGTYWLEYYVNGRRIRESLDTGVLREAEAKRARKIAPIQAGSAVDKARVMVHRLTDAKDAARAANDIPLDEAWDMFRVNSSRSSKTTAGYGQIWSAFLAWAAKDRAALTTLGSIDRQTALAYADHLAARKTSPRTFNAHRQALSLITGKLIVKAGLDIPNPWKAVELKPLDTISRKEFTRPEILHVLERLADPGFTLITHTAKGDGERPLPCRKEWCVIFHLGAFAGLRLADCAMLNWDDIDLAREELTTIPRKTVRKLKRVHLPILPLLRDQLRLATAWRDDSGNVCPQIAKRYAYNPSGVDKDAIAILEACGFTTSRKREGRAIATPQYGFHSFRHTFVSICAEAGVPLSTVQAFVGHGSPAMTRHYTHVSRDAARRAMQALDFSPTNALPAPAKAIPSADDTLARIRARLDAEDADSPLRRDLLAILNG